LRPSSFLCGASTQVLVANEALSLRCVKNQIKPALTSAAANMDASSDRLFCCRWVRNKVPAACRDELYHILRMTGPLLLSRILHYLLPFVVTMFCGRLGNDVMAGYGLASAAINVTTAATGCGLGLACDTLVSQTFGGQNLLRVGVILQRGIIILLLFCLPCWGLLINAEAILLCMGQEPEVAMFLYNLQVSYLQNQGIIMPQMYTALLANVANLATNYAFLHWANLGVVGSAAANTLSQIYICVFLFAYIWWKKLHVNTWGGWSVESLQEWGSYMKLAIPSLLMVCFEWWVYEFGGFFAGMLSEDELAAQHAVIMIAFITYMFPLGIQAAACARVGNALGAGDTARALLASKLSLSLAGVVLGCTKTVIGHIFTSDDKSVCRTEPEVSHVRLLSSQCVCTGIFLGTGKQRIPAVANFIAYYCVGLTMSVVLMFVAKLRVLGFWLGLLICVVLHSTFYIIVIFRLNWKKMTEEVFQLSSSLTVTTPRLSQPVSSSGQPCPDRCAILSTKGCTPVKTQQHDGNSETRVEQEVRRQKGGRLSTTQLIIRRGLTMVTALAFLAVGTAVHFLVPLPEIGSNSTLDGINTTFTPHTISSPVL
uniref:Multidrug and toxin extrusion protein n=1 Tax=Xiphophorus couchianus TaxID=32473 RepID=A0A3B5LTQ9_9TELE